MCFAVARHERSRLISTETAANLLRQFGHLRQGWREIAPTDRVRDLAQGLIRAHPLRAADAFQLAAATIAADGSPSSLEFVSFDDRLRSAAEREGFAVIKL